MGHALGPTYFAIQTRCAEVADIHARKELKESEKILDFMSSSELIANFYYAGQGMQINGQYFNDSTIDEINVGYLESWGFYEKIL